MNHDAALRRHARAVAYVRWQLSSEKYSALRRAHADAAIDEAELRAAAEDVRRRHAEWMRLGPEAPTGGGDEHTARRSDEATQ